MVLQKSAKIALVNLGNVSRSLQRAFKDTEMLADKKLQTRKELVQRIPSGVAVLNTIRVHPVFGKEEQTLGQFFDKDQVAIAMEECGKTHDEVERRINDLKQTMEEFIQQGDGLKSEVLGWTVKQISDGGHVQEITLIADKIERGISLFPSNETSSTYPQCMNHPRPYPPQSDPFKITLANTSQVSWRRLHPSSTLSKPPINYVRKSAFNHKHISNDYLPRKSIWSLSVPS